MRPTVIAINTWQCLGWDSKGFQIIPLEGCHFITCSIIIRIALGGNTGRWLDLGLFLGGDRLVLSFHAFGLRAMSIFSRYRSCKFIPAKSEDTQTSLRVVCRNQGIKTVYKSRAAQVPHTSNWHIGYVKIHFGVQQQAVVWKPIHLQLHQPNGVACKSVFLTTLHPPLWPRGPSAWEPPESWPMQRACISWKINHEKVPPQSISRFNIVVSTHWLQSRRKSNLSLASFGVGWACSFIVELWFLKSFVNFCENIWKVLLTWAMNIPKEDEAAFTAQPYGPGIVGLPNHPAQTTCWRNHCRTTCWPLKCIATFCKPRFVCFCLFSNKRIP